MSQVDNLLGYNELPSSTDRNHSSTEHTHLKNDVSVNVKQGSITLQQDHTETIKAEQ